MQIKLSKLNHEKACFLAEALMEYNSYLSNISNKSILERMIYSISGELYNSKFLKFLSGYNPGHKKNHSFKFKYHEGTTIYHAIKWFQDDLIISDKKWASLEIIKQDLLKQIV